ncbi:MAG TPA: ATP-binding protein [Candidatus Binataceae bacterium]|nr:ATP-binding protein [Candidatus Binataceae bacterium]
MAGEPNSQDRQASDGALRGNLARRFIIGSMVAAVPGVVALGIVNFYSIRSLTIVNRQLDEITLSLDATRDLQTALIRVARSPDEYVLHHYKGEEKEFDQALKVAQRKLVACSSAPCHAATKSPREMASLLEPKLEILRRDGGMVFRTASSQPPAGSKEIDKIDDLLGGIDTQFGEMSDALLGRVEKLRERAQVVDRQALMLTGFATAAVLVFGVASALVLAKRVSRPLEKLLVGTRRVRGGEWDYRVQIEDAGEIGELATSFNVMLNEIQRHRDQLRDYGRVLEERVRERTDELKRSDKALRESEKLASVGLLAAGVAHELNNPLTSILMNANLIMEDVGKDSPLLGDLRKIDTDATRCKRIIDDLRTFSRPRDLRLAPCRVETLVDQALELSDHELSARGIKVETQIAPNLPQPLWDGERITQVLTNLFVNAAQAMKNGGTLTVSAQQSGQSIALQVRDTGEGIPQQYRSRILEPFFTTKPTGTGLGLSISYGIVQEHGGSIEMESITREEADPTGRTGTTVNILIPLSAPQEQA